MSPRDVPEPAALTREERPARLRLRDFGEKNRMIDDGQRYTAIVHDTRDRSLRREVFDERRHGIADEKMTGHARRRFDGTNGGRDVASHWHEGRRRPHEKCRDERRADPGLDQSIAP